MKRLTDAEKKLIDYYASKGFPYGDIARRVGRAAPTVRYYLKPKYQPLTCHQKAAEREKATLPDEEELAKRVAAEREVIRRASGCRWTDTLD